MRTQSFVTCHLTVQKHFYRNKHTLTETSSSSSEKRIVFTAVKTSTEPFCQVWHSSSDAPWWCNWEIFFKWNGNRSVCKGFSVNFKKKMVSWFMFCKRKEPILISDLCKTLNDLYMFFFSLFVRHLWLLYHFSIGFILVSNHNVRKKHDKVYLHLGPQNRWRDLIHTWRVESTLFHTVPKYHAEVAPFSVRIVFLAFSFIQRS